MFRGGRFCRRLLSVQDSQRTADMNFEELIETHSRGPATAVTTLESNVAELNSLNEDLRRIQGSKPFAR